MVQAQKSDKSETNPAAAHHRCPFEKMDGPGKWNQTHLNQPKKATPHPPNPPTPTHPHPPSSPVTARCRQLPHGAADAQGIPSEDPQTEANLHHHLDASASASVSVSQAEPFVARPTPMAALSRFTKTGQPQWPPYQGTNGRFVNAKCHFMKADRQCIKAQLAPNLDIPNKAEGDGCWFLDTLAA